MDVHLQAVPQDGQRWRVGVADRIVGTAWWAARAFARQPWAPVLTVVAFLVAAAADRRRTAWAIAGAGVVLAWLRWRDDGTGERWVGSRVRTSWWAWRAYGSRWAVAMAGSGLGDDELAELPYLVGVSRTATGAVLAVETVPGQPADHIVARAPVVAELLGVAGCTLRSAGAGAVWLEVRSHDARPPLWQAHARSTPFDALALVVGSHHDTTAWRLPLAASNTLVVGEPGTGTTCLVRAIVAAARPLTHDGRTALWAVDTTGGAGLADLGPYARSGFGGAADIERLLDHARTEVRTRAAQRRHGGGHHPHPAEPLVVLVIDDVSTALATAAADVDARARRMRRALNIVLAEGPAVGVVVVAVVKDLDQVTDVRHLFKNRVAFRLADPAATDHVLGRGARRLGAACDSIPPPPAGVGIAYAWFHTEAAPARVYVDCVDDEERSA
jgi:DNA segregation ATPase FtsK/SpoIIIE, S-DNA-T family